MAIIKKRAYDLDFCQFDEQIILLMAQSGSHLARNELIERYLPRVKKQVDRLARLRRLPRDEIPDAEQNAVFGMDEAIRKYRLDEPGVRIKCAFPSYLHRVVECQLLDTIKAFRRKAKHTDSSVRAKKAFEALAEGTASRPSRSLPNEKHAKSFHAQSREPVADAEAKEFQQRWSRAVAQLIPEDRRLYEACASGRSMRSIAQDLGLPERSLYQKKRSMLVRLRAQLRGGGNEQVLKVRSRPKHFCFGIS